MECLKDNPDCFPPDLRPVVARESTGRAPSEEDIPRGRHIQPANQVEQRTLPASARTDKRTEVSLAHFDRDPIEPGDGVATTLINFRHLVECHHVLCFSIRILTRRIDGRDGLIWFIWFVLFVWLI
ncbi:MAG: hypothetical protein EWM73_03674 [Nitrospira sp.]|nr:MAG: hypothetical protein EWM73_03674 [Nitrospira sp.]